MRPKTCALVTGSTGGLGLAIALRLARDGWNILLSGLDHSAEAVEAQRLMREEHGVDALFHAADLADPDAIAELVAKADGAFGGVGILVNNAVVRHFAPVEAFPVERWNHALAVNLSAAFHLIRLALPGMRARGWGRIVNVSSIYGQIGAANRVDYVTTKTALLGLTRAVALETAEVDITCNSVCPGTLPTPAILDRIAGLAASDGISGEEATRAYLRDRQPGGRFIEMETVASLVSFLCGPGGRDISGATLPVDRGWSVA